MPTAAQQPPAPQLHPVLQYTPHRPAPEPAPEQTTATPPRTLRRRRGIRVLHQREPTSTLCLHILSVEMRPIDDLRREGPANAFVNAASHSIILGRRIEVESPLLAPVAHDCQ